MKPIAQPRPERRGGRRDYQPGRPRSGRRQIVIRIKEEILDRLEPGAAAKIRELVEATYGDT